MKNQIEQEVVCNLTTLVSELVELEDWPCVNLDGALLLYDVCQCLRLSKETTFSLLGSAATHYLVEKGIIDKVAVRTLGV